jgi:hypothetical protein
MQKDDIKKINETDFLIIKIVIILFITIIGFLITLILFKVAIEKKLIFKLSHYL